jgi:hypothetical protein
MCQNSPLQKNPIISVASEETISSNFFSVHIKFQLPIEGNENNIQSLLRIAPNQTAYALLQCSQGVSEYSSAYRRLSSFAVCLVNGIKSSE